ncbi:hypothetical protein [Ktedonobacter racemifer]|uniref:Uncharacterized protein n=1 Tax=Ktedonobacter racemifer DSM 44963 TaxID=485913 RepID=D6TUF0_KTERA|nr:hypothetical protein [Ktedonobacter racemifer]EFH84018.1 hypothetical protein Krac_5028 [Ktedonobacter racemifer DSM 44963]
MQFTSYTSLKFLHDQQVQEALERYHPDAGHTASKPERRQVFRKLFARFHRQPDCQPTGSLALARKPQTC